MAVMLNTIFLDRDGVINEVVLREGVVSSPRSLDEFAIRPEFIEFHEQLEPDRFNLFVISNQPDVARELLDPLELAAMTAGLERFNFREIVYCLHDDRQQCQCLKPKPGMITSLLDKHGLDKSQSILIGDSKKDILAGQAAGIRTVYLKQAYNQQPGCQPEYIVDSLREILGIITLV
jgi:D-glycero-D-manno-heptose 1,7-bisphosphate phosphatase